MNPEMISKEQYYENLNNYYSILEKTNQQLSLWYNPYGLSVAILTGLFAIAAIVISIILFKNSREQKNLQKEFFDEQKRIIKEQQDKLNNRYDEGQKQFDVLIAEHEQKLKSVGDAGKKQIEKEINDLKKQKATLGIEKYYSDDLSIYSFNKKSIICSQCGKTFNYYDDSNSDPLHVSSVRLFDFEKVKKLHCSHCGAINIAS